MWGTPSGDGNKTGFEEEFARSFEKYKKTGSPDMWLFFKEVEPVRRSDPGEQLQKVMAFRSAQIEAKELLFKEFKDARDWREMVESRLIRLAFRLIRSKSGENAAVQSRSAPQSQAYRDEATGGTPKPQSKSGKAFTSLAETLKIALTRIEAGKLLVFGNSEPLQPSDAARLLLFAATNYDWHEQRSLLGTHEINSVYWHRQALALTNQERTLLIRTVLLDNSLTKPGWFWLHYWKVPLRQLFSYLIEANTGHLVQVAAIELATRIKFPLNKAVGKQGKQITRILQNTNEQVRLAGLNYLSQNGTSHEIQDVVGLLADSDKGVRINAERTKRVIELRMDPDGKLRRSLQLSGLFDEETILALSPYLRKVLPETLQLAMKHPSGAVRSLAARELLARGLVAKELAQRMIQDEGKQVRECGYLALIRIGELPDQKRVHESLDTAYWSPDVPAWNKGNAEIVLQEAFENLPLVALWERVYALSDDSPLALRAIGRKFYNESAAQIRAEVSDDFAARAKLANEKQSVQSYGLSFLGTPLGGVNIESVRDKLCTIALQLVADHPLFADRELFLNCLVVHSAKLEPTMECLRGLASVGKPEDRLNLSPFLDSTNSLHQAAAARAYLLLSPNLLSAAKELLSVPNALERTWTVIAFALNRRERKMWSVLEMLLNHDDENIRRWVAYFAVSMLTRKQIVKLLNHYLAKGPYFYNVVTILDRALYAPPVIRRVYLEDERAFFNRWHESADRYWPGLLQ